MIRTFNRLTELRDYPRGGPADPSTWTTQTRLHGLGGLKGDWVGR